LNWLSDRFFVAQLSRTGVADVEKGTKPVISVNFSVYGRRTLNNFVTATYFPAPVQEGRLRENHSRVWRRL
jgi:hypothetical protein